MKKSTKISLLVSLILVIAGAVYVYLFHFWELVLI